MGKPRNRYALVNIDKMRIIAVEGKVLVGSCKRCGKCCPGRNGEGHCEYLIFETLDGKQWNRCAIYHNRPARCALYPQPQDDFPDGCGFRYEEHS